MKKYLKVMVVFAMVFAFLPPLVIGCSDKQASATSGKDKTSSSAASKVEISTSTSEKEPASTTSKAETSTSKSTSEKEAESVKPEENDPYGLYRVSEDWAKKMSVMVVERNGVLYSLSGQVPQAVLDDYGVGYARGRRGLEDRVFLFMHDQAKITDVPTASAETLIAAGDFPLIKINRNEQVRLYSTGATDYISIVPTKQIGYTIEAIAHSDNEMYSPVLDDTMIGGQIVGNNPSVCDMTDTPVADVHDLVYGQSYKYIWYKGTKYNEITLTADCRCYEQTVTNSLDPRAINLPVTLGKDDYATVDFSGVAPGIYYILFPESVIEVE